MEKTKEELEKLISVTRLRLQAKSPFFATLSLFTEFKFSDHISTAATDGKDIYLNPNFFVPLSTLQKEGLILHELLHAALLHPLRLGERDPFLWNIAADMVVNLMIVNEKGFELPEGGILPPTNWRKWDLKQEPDWEKLSAEEFYELLLTASKHKQNFSYFNNDYLDLLNNDSGLNDSSLGDRTDQLRHHWQNAMQQAIVVTRNSKQGTLPMRIERLMGEISNSQLDWRSYLWRYLVQTPNDFQGFDRRFVSRGLYLDHLVGESVQVYVAIDTSGSIGDEQTGIFIGELLGILHAYPHLECHLYYADDHIHGPYDIDKYSEIPKPVGGWGTSFIPFFEAVEKQGHHGEGVCIYLTDGYGFFPESEPSLPVLWVVCAGGLDLQEFPFGETVRLLNSV